MIEFELKYKLTETPETLNNFPIIKTKKQSDIYYDTKNYTLIKKGNFLRIRDNNILDFKMDINDSTHSYCKETSFNVSEIDRKIIEINLVLTAIGLPVSKNVEGIEDFLTKNDFVELARIDKIRKIYKLDDNCTLCIDEVDNLGLFLEAEIMINNDSIDQQEMEKIKSVLVNRLIDNKIIDLSYKTINTGYVELYLLKHNPKVYDLGIFKL